jgi:putative copper resistance protein D
LVAVLTAIEMQMRMSDGMSMPAPFSWTHLYATRMSWSINLALVLAVIAYVAGVRSWNRRQPTTWSAKRSLAFAFAIVIVGIATEALPGVYDMTLFSAHMVQHLLLIMVAAGLFAMAAPLELALATLPGAIGRGFHRLVDSKLGEVIGHPIFGFAAYAIFIPSTHLTSLFNQMLLHMWVHRLEQVAFLLIGYLFWRPVVGIEPSRHPLAPGLRLVYLALAVPIDTFTGLALVMSGHIEFSAYAAQHRTWGPSILSDIKTGGALMWIGGDLLMLGAMIPVAYLWMKDEESKTVALDARLDAERAAQAIEDAQAASSAQQPGVSSQRP